MVLLGPARTLMLSTSCSTWTHNSTERKGGVAEAVTVGSVGVRLCVTVTVGDEVAVEGSGVTVWVMVGDTAIEGVQVGVGVSSGGGPCRGISKKANRRIMAIRAGIPN